MHVVLNIRNMKQETDFYCGAACAKMLLNKIRSKHTTQKILFDESQRNGRFPHEGWNSPPDGLTKTINSRRPSSFRNKFELTVSKNSQQYVTKEILRGIQLYDMPSIALVDAGRHWIVVKGFSTTDNISKNSNLNIGHIKELWINDPWNESSAIAHRPVPYETWQSSYLMPIAFGRHWLGKYIGICDPPSDDEDRRRKKNMKKKKVDSVSDDKGKNTVYNKVPDEKRENEQNMAKVTLDDSSKNNDVSSSKGTKSVGSSKGVKIIKKAIVADTALQTLDTRGYRDIDFLKDVVKDVKASEPILIHRLDAVDQFYYIVPLVDSITNSICSLMSIDAIAGNYRESAFAKSKTKPIIFKPLGKEEIRKLLSKKLRLKEPKRVLNMNPDVMCLYPLLVWTPCLESFSPYLPFHMVIIGGYIIFVRIDGKVFTKLSTNVLGA
jgi:hypothetical protein